LLLSGIGPKEHLQAVNVTVVKDLPGKQTIHRALKTTSVVATSREAGRDDDDDDPSMGDFTRSRNKTLSLHELPCIATMLLPHLKETYS